VRLGLCTKWFLTMVGILAGTLAVSTVILSSSWLADSVIGPWPVLALVWAIGLMLAWLATVRGSAPLRQVVDGLQRMADQPDAELPMVRSGDELEALCEAVAAWTGRLNERVAEARRQNEQMNIRIRIAESQKKQSEAILNSISDPVIVTDSFDEVVMANAAAQDLFGFRLNGKGRPKLAEVVSCPTLVELVTNTRRRMGKVARRSEELTYGEEEDPRIFQATASSVVDANDEVVGVVGVLRDVTRDKEVEKTKSDFVSAVSHELNTPLASIKAYIEMLVDGDAKDPDIQQEFYQIIDTQADRMTRLIQNLLNLSRIESGVVKVNKEVVSMSEVAEGVVRVMAPVAEERRLELVSQLSPLYIGVLADRDMLSQAILNLVSNAIKYTPKGGTVAIRTQMLEGKALCEITDTGLGIGPEDMGKVFEKFYRIKANSKAASGTGLGLPLVKRIVEEIHDGTIDVESEVGKGSTFRFVLPLSGSLEASSLA